MYRVFEALDQLVTIVEEARGTYDLSATRLVAGAKLPAPGSAAAIEVFTAP